MRCHYRPPSKLLEGNAFGCVCLSVFTEWGGPNVIGYHKGTPLPSPFRDPQSWTCSNLFTWVSPYKVPTQTCWKAGGLVFDWKAVLLRIISVRCKQSAKFTTLRTCRNNTYPRRFLASHQFDRESSKISSSSPYKHIAQILKRFKNTSDTAETVNLYHLHFVMLVSHIFVLAWVSHRQRCKYWHTVKRHWNSSKHKKY